MAKKTGFEQSNFEQMIITHMRREVMFQPGLRLESRRDLKESENFFQSAIFFGRGSERRRSERRQAKNFRTSKWSF